MNIKGTNGIPTMYNNIHMSIAEFVWLGWQSIRYINNGFPNEVKYLIEA